MAYPHLLQQWVDGTKKLPRNTRLWVDDEIVMQLRLESYLDNPYVRPEQLGPNITLRAIAIIPRRFRGSR